MDRVTVDLPRELDSYTPQALALLRAKVAEGLASGESEPLDMAEIKQAARLKLTRCKVP